MSDTFDHKALHIKPFEKIVFTAMSKRYFYMRLIVTKFVLDEGCTPLNPFTTFDYFLLDTVERDVVRKANNTLVARSDELWVFGDISDGVQAEIVQAEASQKPVRYFRFENDREIIEIDNSELVYEAGVGA